MRIDILSVLPDLFESVLTASITGRAISSGALDVTVHDLRDWTDDRHRTTDDYPFGGGPGMVMKPEPVYRAVEDLIGRSASKPRVILMTPQGRPLDQALVTELGAEDSLLLVCGRYEGFDERIRALADDEVSIGDYVLTGGELAALVVVDAVSRLQPGVLGAEDSVEDESFAEGLLEYPQYTRPATFRDLSVPEVLLSGDHARIAAWRRREAIRRTAERRPELIERADLTDEERAYARRVTEEWSEPSE